MKPIFSKIFRASTAVAIAHLLLKFSGLIQARCATQFLSPDLYEPIMVVAFSGVINTLFLIGQELIHPTFLSVFMQEKEQNGEKAAWDFAGSTLSAQSLILLFLTSTVLCFPEFYIALFTNWTPASHPASYNLLRHSLRIMAPALFFLSLGSTTYVILNGYKKFFLAAFGDASTKICIILGLLLGIGLFGMDYRVLLFSIVIGAAAKLITHLFGMLDKIKMLSLRAQWNGPAFRSMLWLMLPLLAGILFAKVRDNFNNIYILTHLKQNGILMANDLGRRLYTSIQWLVPYSLQIALFPFLCELVSKNDKEKLGEILGGSCRMLLDFFVPVAIILAILAKPIAVLFFCGGKTPLAVALWTALSMSCYTLVLPASAVECVLMQGFFADRRTIAVTLFGLLFSSLSVLASWVCITRFHTTPEQSLIIVALSFTISRYLKSITLALYMNRLLPLLRGGKTAAHAGRLLLLALLTAGITWGIYHYSQQLWPAFIQEAKLGIAPLNRWNLLKQLLLSGAAGALLPACWLLLSRGLSPAAHNRPSAEDC